MQNLTAQDKNITALKCDLCLRSPIFIPAVVPYTLISLPINGRVLWLMISSPVFWTDRTEVSEFHLVLTELLAGFLQLPVISASFNPTSEIVHIIAKIIDVIFTARLQFQSYVCIERYLAVVHPVMYLRFKPLRYRMSSCCVIWLQTVLFATVQMFLCSNSQISVGIYVGIFVSLFIIDSFCCLSVLMALKQPSPGEGEREGSNLIKKRAFNIVLIFQMTTFFGYVPLIITLLMVERIDGDILCICQPLAHCLMIWCGVIPPILYLHRAKKLLKTSKK